MKGIRRAMAVAGLVVLLVVAQPASAAERSLVDRPDDAPGREQVHAIYALPADGADRELDKNGTLADSVATWQQWLREQAADRGLRLDTASGELDVSFVRLQKTGAELEAAGPYVRDRIEDELSARGLLKARKVYAVYYDGRSSYSCGGGAYPGTIPGQVAALYLNGLPESAIPCRSNDFSTPSVGPRYFEFGMLHELLHTLGFVASCAPNQWRAGHVSDNPRDLMYAGDEPWRPSVLDAGRDDYFASGRTGCADLAASPFREGNAASRLDPTASLTVSPNPALTGHTVSFDASGSGDSDGTIARYEWDLDGDGSFETHTGASPTIWRAYTSPGTVTVKLRVTDNDGATNGTSRTLQVDAPQDTTPPDTLITSAPSGSSISSSTASYAFSSTEAGSTFECRLDSGALAPCSSPKALTGLSNGQHTFSVQAKDAAGNTDPSPATGVFTINVAYPLPRDSDGDGVPNATDRCPLLAGPAARGGCPAPSPTTASAIKLPSNVFSFIGKVRAQPRLIILALRVPGPGLVKAAQAGSSGARASASGPLVRPVRVVARKAGKVTLKLRPSQAGRKRLSRRKSFSVRLKVTYTPTGGKPRSKAKRVTMRIR